MPNNVPTTPRNVVVNPLPQGAALGGHLFSGNITVPPPANFNLSLHNNVPATQSNAVANPSPQEAVVGGTSSVYWYFNQISAPTDQNGEKISGNFFSPPRYQIVSAEEYEKNLMPSNVFGSSYIPYQGCNCIQMRPHAQMLSALDQMPPLSTSTPRYDDMQHLGATGNMDHYVVERAKPMMKKPYKCNFCAKNQEKDISHQLKSETGEVLCPILREIICKICGATQANAHTPKFCPQKHRNRREPMTLDRHFPPLREMNSSGT